MEWTVIAGTSRPRTRLALLMILLLLATCLAAALAPAAHAADSCVDVRFVAVRGSGEAGGAAGATATQQYNDIKPSLPGGTTSKLSGIVYPALPDNLEDINLGNAAQMLATYNASEAAGVANLGAYLAGQAGCIAQGEQWVLLGFSQGAQVVEDVIASGSLSAAQLGAIAAVLVIASPMFNSAESFDTGTFQPGTNGLFSLIGATRPLGALGAVSGRITAFCDAHDIVCQGLSGADAAVHDGLRYVSSYRAAMASFVAARVAAPVTPPGGSGGTDGAGGSGGSGSGSSGSNSEGAAQRIGGADRYATSAAIAAAFGRSGAVVIANGEDAKAGFDALAANYLAGRVGGTGGAPILLTNASELPAATAGAPILRAEAGELPAAGAGAPILLTKASELPAGGAPILLTKASELPPATAAAVRAVLAGAAHPAVYILGRADSVSDAVAAELASIAADVAGAAGDYVHRIGGADRYATSSLVSTFLPTADVGSFTVAPGQAAALPTAILASGEVNADALAAGPLSDALGIPVLLTTASGLPDAVAGAITSLGIKQLLVLGGADRVSQHALDQAAAAGVTSTHRIAGPDRYATAAALYTFARGALAGAGGEQYGAGAGNGTSVYLANGVTGFPDALSAGPLAGKHQDALLTVPGPTLPLPAEAFLRANSAAVSTVIALGRTPTVAAAALAVAKAALS